MDERQLLNLVHAPCKEKRYGIECHQGVNLFGFAVDIFHQNKIFCDREKDCIRVEAGYDVNCHNATVHLLQHATYHGKTHSHVHVYRKGDLLRIKKIEFERLKKEIENLEQFENENSLSNIIVSAFHKVFDNEMTEKERQKILGDTSFEWNGMKKLACRRCGIIYTFGKDEEPYCDVCYRIDKVEI